MQLSQKHLALLSVGLSVLATGLALGIYNFFDDCFSAFFGANATVVAAWLIVALYGSGLLVAVGMLVKAIARDLPKKTAVITLVFYITVTVLGMILILSSLAVARHVSLSLRAQSQLAMIQARIESQRLPLTKESASCTEPGTVFADPSVAEALVQAQSISKQPPMCVSAVGKWAVAVTVPNEEHRGSFCRALQSYKTLCTDFLGRVGPITSPLETAECPFN